jgi:ABC-2 type transport system permease protein
VRSLGMAIAMPMLLLVMFGYALTLDVDNVPMVVWDQSGSAASRDFVSEFTGSRYLVVRGYANNYGELERAIDTREALVALVIPRDFAEHLKSGRTTSVQLIADGSDANTATIALGYAEAVVQGFSQKLAVEHIRRIGGRSLSLPLDVRARVWFNTDMESKNFIIPGLIALIMMVIAALLTSLTVAREWERGTMEQLISTPVRGAELILGKLIPYFAIGMFDVLLAVLMGEFLYHVPFRGSVVLLFSVSAIFLFGGLSLGMLISIVARNQLVAIQMSMVGTFLPTFLLSGFMFAIPNLPKPIQLITYIVPARYFITILRAVYLKGVGLEILMLEVVLLAVFGALMVLLAHKKLKNKLA